MAEKETILVTGGTGLIGTALVKLLVRSGYRVIILSRSRKSGGGDIHYAQWDVQKGTIDREAIEQADHIIHLAGANVASERWTDKRKKIIRESRVNSGLLLVKSLKEIPNQVQTVISASGIGCYGPDEKGPGRPFKESDPYYDDFLGETCRLWEGSLQPVTEMGRRLVFFRNGIVLSREGGALPEFLKPLKAGVAGILGDGRQIISWIHMDDVCRMFLMAVENKNLSGAYNAVAPRPVSNKELVLTAAKESGKKFIAIPVPSLLLKIALGEMSVEVLKSTTAGAGKIRDAGFTFIYPDITPALKQLMSERPV